MISRRRAPIALRRPISKVRSLTVTSMMFITTIPPTTSEISVIGVTTIAIAPVNWSTSWFTSSTFTRPKSSSSPPRSLWWTRIATRASSIASGKSSREAPRPWIWRLWWRPKRRPYVVIGT